MINRIAPLLVLVGALGLTACESSNPPIAPSSVAQSSAPVAPGSPDDAGAPTFSKPADTGDIVIDRGELDFGEPDVQVSFGEIRLLGNRGFSLTAFVSRTGGIVEAVAACIASNCAPGTVIPLRAFWSGNDLHASVTLDGTTYTSVGSLASPTVARVEFSGSVVAPPLTKRGSDQVTAPFTMTGLFSYPGGSVTFTGEGVVKLWLDHTPGSTGWRVERLLYRFKHRP